MCRCLSSLFLPLPLPDVPTLRSDWRWRLRWIQHTVVKVSIGKSAGFSSLMAGARRLPRAFDSEDLGFRAELGFKENPSDHFELDSSIPNVDVTNDASDFSSLNFLEKDVEKKKTTGSAKDGDLVRLEGEGDLKKTGSRGRKQMMKRSNLVAKQVISIQSALGLGFISQLWVDTTSWVVLAVEVKPSLLAGESERFLLEDVVRVGDVVLVEDETVLENDFKMVGLETLVGYRVVTPGQRSIGKVRGYTFNTNSGIVESLELDYFGISIIPSSLVSTYVLHVKDILEVLSDIVVVDEAAASRIQRLTKGLWDAQYVGTSIDELSGYSDIEELETFDKRRRKRRGTQSNRSRRKKRDKDDDDDDDGWGIPLDFV